MRLLFNFRLGQWLLASLLACNATSALSDRPIEPLPVSVQVNANKAALGKRLYYDTRLSLDNSVSCASCHRLDKKFYGTDRSQFSTGIKGLKGGRNSPTVFNASLNLAQFWDGRAADLAQQALGPVVNPVEMGMPSWEAVVSRLEKDAYYPGAFQSIFGKKMSKETIAEAIAEFEKTLITANSPFDRYLRGDKSAITDQQKRGFELFKSYGCVSCHQGQNVGGNLFQKFGVLKDIVLQDGSLSADLGRYNVTKNEWDKRVFKVPSLRLAVKTPPYFHDGSVATIEEAVNIMIQFQLGREVPDADQQAIIAFLESLVGEIPAGVRKQ